MLEPDSSQIEFNRKYMQEYKALAQKFSGWMDNQGREVVRQTFADFADKNGIDLERVVKTTSQAKLSQVDIFHYYSDLGNNIINEARVSDEAKNSIFKKTIFSVIIEVIREDEYIGVRELTEDDKLFVQEILSISPHQFDDLFNSEFCKRFYIYLENFVACQSQGLGEIKTAVSDGSFQADPEVYYGSREWIEIAKTLKAATLFMEQHPELNGSFDKESMSNNDLEAFRNKRDFLLDRLLDSVHVCGPLLVRIVKDPEAVVAMLSKGAKSETKKALEYFLRFTTAQRLQLGQNISETKLKERLRVSHESGDLSQVDDELVVYLFAALSPFLGEDSDSYRIIISQIKRILRVTARWDDEVYSSLLKIGVCVTSGNEINEERDYEQALVQNFQKPELLKILEYCGKEQISAHNHH